MPGAFLPPRTAGSAASRLAPKNRRTFFPPQARFLRAALSPACEFVLITRTLSSVILRLPAAAYLLFADPPFLAFAILRLSRVCGRFQYTQRIHGYREPFCINYTRVLGGPHSLSGCHLSCRDIIPGLSCRFPDTHTVFFSGFHLKKGTFSVK